MNCLVLLLFLRDFPGGSDNKESACNVGDLGLIPGLGRPGPGPKTALPEGPRLREPPLSTPRAPQPATVARSRHAPRTQPCRRGGGTGGTAGLQNPPASNFRSWGRDQLTSGPAGADGTVDFQTRGRGEARGSSLPGPPLSPREERTGGAIE